MPVYEFECSCGEVTEDIVKVGTEQIKCPKCQQTATKVMSRCSFQLVGGGWYADGYSSKKSASPKK
jgi:putative FmdB family regulatory protein